MKWYYYLTALVICLLTLLAFSFIFNVWEERQVMDIVQVGFLSENDSMTVNTNNFAESRYILEKEFGDHLQFFTRTNVGSDQTEEALLELIRSGCDIIFTNTRSNTVRVVARNHPDVQFCQISNGIAPSLTEGRNFHTFNARIYEGHYVAGMAAGMKLREMIDSGEIAPEEALVGYVGSYPTAEIISGYTAFFLGVRSTAPEAVMHVRYAYALSNFLIEKNNAKALIDEGCVIIAQNTGTTGPALACEEASAQKAVYHVGCNESMIDEAPSSSLISPRTNWDPYMVAAIRAVMTSKNIEDVAIGKIHGNDVSAGFDQKWVEMMELNENIAAKDTKLRMNHLIEEIIRGRVDIFRGNYIGVNPEEPRIIYELNWGYKENSASSKPTFHYVLRDVITVEN